jgi:two-component system, NtrC family, sensor histidine kinase HydH
MKAAVASWRSLDRRLPLWITAVLLATIAAFSASTYHLVRKVLLTAAGERLQGASTPIAVSLAQGVSRQRALYSELARDPAIANFLVTGTGREAARRALARGWGTTQPPRGRIELLDAQGDVVLDTVGAVAPSGSAWADRVISAGSARVGETLIAPLGVDGETVFGGSLVPVPGPDSGRAKAGGRAGDPPVLGYILDTQVIVGQGVQSIRELLGREAALFVGSPEEGVWTDLEGLAAPPPAGLRVGSPLVYDSSARGPGVGAATAIAGAPWLLWVEQSQSAVLTPMNYLLGKLAMLAFLFILGGAVGAWVLGRRITQPIVALANAADRVATGTAPIAADPQPLNEVARLTDAFERMWARVQGSTEGLEGLVAERTARLERALSELELAQQELVKKERLAMLGQLASAVGHELRNPLGVLTNALYVIEQCLPDGPPLVHEYLDLMRGQIAASERIVGDLLDTARIRAPETEIIDLRELVEAQVRRLLPTTAVAIKQRFRDDLPMVRMDPIQLSQILLNLITNAVQAMGDAGGGVLTIGATVDQAGGRVRLSISDTGPGMPPDVLERIFDPLFTTKARGLGLGLWVSQSLATANGATLHATSQPGNGSTFTLDMPAVVAAEVTVA